MKKAILTLRHASTDGNNYYTLQQSNLKNMKSEKKMLISTRFCYLLKITAQFQKKSFAYLLKIIADNQVTY